MRAAAAGAIVAVATFGLVAAVAGVEGGADGGGEDAPARTAESAPGRTAEFAPARAEIAAGRELFARMACGSCHSLAAADARGQIGPDLSRVLGGYTRESLVATIRNPPSNGDFVAMPRDFGKRMTPAELDALAAFLIAARDR